MQPASLIIDRVASMATPGPDGTLRVVRDAAIAADHNGIIAAGSREAVLRAVTATDDAVVINADGMSAIPGLVDCHTHAVYAGSRVDEFDRRAQGQSYEQIAAAGGGIQHTMRSVRAATEQQLVADTTRRLARMRTLGTTTAEVKSGYGQDAANEAKMLRAASTAAAAAGVRVVTTLLALHTVAPEAASADAHVEAAIAQVLPACADLASAADVFLERGAFDADQCRRFLFAAARRGLAPRMHGDQFSRCGAIELAVELRAASVDHLEQTDADGVALLASSDVTGVLLPLCALYLDLPMPPARSLLEAGARVAIATDYNPGSAPCESLLAALNVACTQMRMSCAETLVAATSTAAAVLGLGGSVGRLAAGYAADIVLINDPDWRTACYHLGEVPARVVAGAGEAVAAA